jgi:hypothetical protein
MHTTALRATTANLAWSGDTIPEGSAVNPILLVTHPYAEPSNELSQIASLVGHDGAVERFVLGDDEWRLPQLQRYAAVVMFVRFRELMERSDLGWGYFAGPKVLLDQDSFMDFCGWYGQSPYEGRWTSVMSTLGFDAILCTGIRSAQHFAERGIRAATLHKGYDEKFFYQEGLERLGLCHYGSPYAARRVMLNRLRRSGIAVAEVRAPYTSLGPCLNRYAGVVICNMTSTVRGGRIGASIEHRFPGALLRVQPAPEPMIKNFEAMGAGCCVFMDRTPDDESLGFVDGETCVLYSDLDELTVKIREYQEDPTRMAAIGERAHALVRSRHTWLHRGVEFRRLLRRLVDAESI